MLVPPNKNKMLSVSAVEFIPQDSRIYLQLNKSQACPAVLAVRKAIEVLSLEPAEFFEIIIPLVGELQREIKGLFQLKAVVVELYDKSLSDVTFQYSGARMCSYLSHHLNLTGLNFHEELVIRCEKEHDKITTGGGFVSLSHFMDFTLLMGELIVNMITIEKVRLSFPKRLVELLLTLISHQSDEALLCVIKSLKLTGAILEQHEPQVQEAYYELKYLFDNPNIDNFAKDQLRRLLDLRCQGWHESLTVPSGIAPYDPTETVDFDSNDEYYDELDAFESLKLDDDDADMNSLPVEFTAEYQMDMEIAEAYENFHKQLPPRKVKEENVEGASYDRDPSIFGGFGFSLEASNIPLSSKVADTVHKSSSPCMGYFAVDREPSETGRSSILGRIIHPVAPSMSSQQQQVKVIDGTTSGLSLGKSTPSNLQTSATTANVSAVTSFTTSTTTKSGTAPSVSSSVTPVTLTSASEATNKNDKFPTVHGYRRI